MQSKSPFLKQPLLLILIFLANTTSAQVYKWTDASGKTHFSDAPSRSHDVEEVSITVKRAGPITPLAHEPVADETTEDVIMYATSWCPYCKKARNYFRDNGIAFTEYDIEKDQRARQRYDRLGGHGVPVILVGNKRMDGFNIADFERMYQ